MTRDEQVWLLKYLRRRLQEMVAGNAPRHPPPRDVPEVWRQAGGLFVTLEVGNRVRGCSGSLYPRLPERWQEAEFALQHALRDSRYRPIREQELRRVRISVTVVVALEPVGSAEQVGGTEYGLVLRSPRGRVGVVLPYEGRRPHERLRWAYRKAGVPEGSPVQIYRLRAHRFAE